jgi:AcrR family transcriptional regulator
MTTHRSPTPRRPGRPPQPAERERLLEAIRDYVLGYGVVDLSFRPLAAELGVSTSKLVYHFGTKDELVSAVLASAEAWQNAEVEGWIATDEDWTVLSVCETFWQWALRPQSQAYFRLYFEVHGAALLRPERFEEAPRAFRTGLEGAIDTVRRRGIPEEEADALGTLLTAVIWGLTLDVLTTGDVERTTAALRAAASAIDARAGPPA